MRDEGILWVFGVGRVKECKSLKNYEKKNAIFTVKVDISQKSEIFYRGNVEINKMYVSGLNTLPCVWVFIIRVFKQGVKLHLAYLPNFFPFEPEY